MIEAIAAILLGFFGLVLITVVAIRGWREMQELFDRINDD